MELNLSGPNTSESPVFDLSSRNPKACYFLKHVYRATCLVRKAGLKDPVLFSCKITHSLIQSLDRRGEDLTVLYESCDWPSEFLRDPSSWLEADKMEALLESIESIYPRREDEESLLITAGHAAKELRAWGVLDSVLRMVQAPKDLFAQPDRFLSYFVSPAPPLGRMNRGSDFVSFDLPLPEQQFPRVATYLRAALEALPTYINKPMATVRWEDSKITIAWSENQGSLFGELATAEGHSLHPELVQSILLNLESSQKELEETKKRLHEVEREAQELRRKLERAGGTGGALISSNEAQTTHSKVSTALHEIYRLGDYFARGQQLVTLLIGQGRMTPQVQEAMRRVDWLAVCEVTPHLIRNVIGELQDANERLETAIADSAPSEASSQPVQARLFGLDGSH